MTTTYPERPGHKGVHDTGREAADRVESKCAYLRRVILVLLGAHGDMTPDEAAKILGEKVSLIRPRFSELHVREKRIIPSGRRGLTDDGNHAVAWRLAGSLEQAELL